MSDIEDTPAPVPTPPASSGVTLQKPVMIGILFLANFLTGVTVFAGVVLAYIWRNEDEAQEWEKTHYTYLIRTFWVGLVWAILFFVAYFALVFGMILQAEQGSPGGPPLTFFASIFVMIGIGFLMAAWFVTRSIMSLVKAAGRKPMPRPKTWLF